MVDDRGCGQRVCLSDRSLEVPQLSDAHLFQSGSDFRSGSFLRSSLLPGTHGRRPRLWPTSVPIRSIPRSSSIIGRSSFPIRKRFQIGIVFKEFPITWHPWSTTAAVANECAYQIDPSKFLNYRTLIFSNQEAISDRDRF